MFISYQKLCSLYFEPTFSWEGRFQINTANILMLVMALITCVSNVLFWSIVFHVSSPSNRSHNAQNKYWPLSQVSIMRTLKQAWWKVHRGLAERCQLCFIRTFPCRSSSWVWLMGFPAFLSCEGSTEGPSARKRFLLHSCVRFFGRVRDLPAQSFPWGVLFENCCFDTSLRICGWAGRHKENITLFWQERESLTL